MLPKIRLFITTIGLFLLISCGSKEKEVIVFRGHGIKCSIPKGWTLKQIDSAGIGGLSILQQESKEAFKPTICLWIDGYDDSLANALGAKPLEILVNMPITSGGDMAQATAFMKKFGPDMGDMHNQKQPTKNTFIDFKSEYTEAVVTMLIGDKGNKEINGISISAASSPSAIDNTRSIADKLATNILKQLNATPNK